MASFLFPLPLDARPQRSSHPAARGRTEALYDRPEFDDFQRAEYFAFAADELALAHRRRGLNEQILCRLQTGYFKAKQAFFALTDLPPEDVEYLRERYFPQQVFSPRSVRPAEHYAQRREILRLSGYRLWSEQDGPVLMQRAAQLVRRDVTPAFVLTELVIWLNQQRIVRPGYTTFQKLISTVLREERQRLAALIEAGTTDDVKSALRRLLVRDESLSELAAIKQDAKYFGPDMMGRERSKREVLEPVYLAARAILPQLGISQQNIAYLRASPTSIPSTICVNFSGGRHSCICCATRGSATGN